MALRIDSSEWERERERERERALRARLSAGWHSNGTEVFIIPRCPAAHDDTVERQAEPTTGSLVVQLFHCAIVEPASEPLN